MNVTDVTVVAADMAVAASLGWWFFGPKPSTETEVADGVQTIRVTVRGGYSPNRIRARAGTPLRLIFNRQESGDCTSRVVFADLGVSADLPAFAETAVELPAQPPGTYGFACGMNMIHGLLDVEDEPAGDVAPPPADVVTPDLRREEPVVARRSEQTGSQSATIVVEAGYHPDKVLAHAGVPLRLVFDRRDEGPCAARVLVPAAGVEATLTEHATTIVDLPALDPGHYEFSCGMGMLHGEIDVASDASDLIAAPPKAAATPAPIVVPPVVPDCCAVPKPESGEDAESAERRAEIADLTRRVVVGAVLTIPVLFGVMAKDFFHPAWLPGALTNPWFGLVLI
ncbi:MAG: cupredoxin domain-containing protein, partial [Acidimicrobiales bacterium]